MSLTAIIAKEKQAKFSSVQFSIWREEETEKYISHRSDNHLGSNAAHPQFFHISLSLVWINSIRKTCLYFQNFMIWYTQRINQNLIGDGRMHPGRGDVDAPALILPKCPCRKKAKFSILMVWQIALHGAEGIGHGQNCGF